MEQETSKGNDFQVDLTNCDREPIHIPGLVQAHGVLAALDDNFKITQISENCAGLFGKKAPELLGKNLREITGEDYFQYLLQEIQSQNIEAAPIYLNAITVNGKNFEIAVHRFQGILIIEFEHPSDGSLEGNQNLYGVLRKRLGEINASQTVREFCRKAAQSVKEFTKFDRVMIYRFAADDSGEVIAEAVNDEMEPFFGLVYPASDIPQQARALYLKQTLRFKTDVNKAAVPLVPTDNPQTAQPLDMSFAVTREMSPIHIEYLKNMGVTATMSVSIVKDGKLWGLIACHHRSPRYITHQARMLCEFIAHTISLQIEAKVNAENYEYINRLKDSNRAIVYELAQNSDVPETLINGENNLLSAVDSDGAALVFDDKIYLVGQTPEEFYVKKIVEWLWKNQTEDVFATDRLSKFLPPAVEYAETVSGLLTARLTSGAPEYLMWFRAEHAHEIKWAGNPEKPVTVGQFGARLTPRKSFETWREEVRHQSKPWRSFELDYAENLRQTIVEVILRRVNELRELNSRLESSNTELDSFAYVASHDLKEPLRGISNYSTFLLEDYGERLDEEGIERLQTMVRLTDRMENLLDSLLHFSRVGRTDLDKKEIELQKTLEDSLLILANRIESSQVAIKIPRPLPRAQADEIRVGEIFSNLISNAIKYNDKDEKEIEIGYLENVLQNVADTPCTEQLFYIRDNGIGIEERHHNEVFRIFKRLHGRNEYSGGVGAGLTIVKKIVERHGGRIWLESKIGEGTTFYFTLG